jgi:hypothetical protein
MTDIARAAAFVQHHARLLDRRRLDRMLGHGSPDAVAAAVAAYANADGGFAGLIEPDVRTTPHHDEPADRGPHGARDPP